MGLWDKTIKMDSSQTQSTVTGISLNHNGADEHWTKHRASEQKHNKFFVCI